MFSRLFWIIPLLIYSSLALYQLKLPGLHYDEAVEVVPAVQLLQGLPVTPFRESALHFAGKPLPLTTQDYIGALNTYLAFPFLAWGGITVFSLRLYSVLIGALTLGVVYGFTRSLTDSRLAGSIAILWLAANPTFIFWNRQGIFVTAITATIGVGAAWSWLLWWRSRAYRYAWLGAFLFGLGLYAKLLFVWLIGALVIVFIALILRSSQTLAMKWQALQLSWAKLAGLIGAGLLGCWPLVLYNLQTGGTFKSITENAATSYYGVNNANVWQNLATRFEQFTILLSGGHLWYLGGVFPNYVSIGVFSLIVVASVWLAWRTRSGLVLFPLAVILLVIGQSIVTVSALWITHYALLMVWPAIALATGWIALQRHFAAYRWAVVGLYGLVIVLLVSEGWQTERYHQALAASGGLGTHSDAIYDLADWLETQPPQPVLAMDWGLAAPIIFLSAGEVNALEVFGYAWQTEDRFTQFVTPYLDPQTAIFLWRAPDEIIFDRSTDFKALYRPRNLEETILTAFYERSGRPIIGATQLVPVGSATNKPVETE